MIRFGLAPPVRNVPSMGPSNPILPPAAHFAAQFVMQISSLDPQRQMDGKVSQCYQGFNNLGAPNKT